MEPEHSGSLSQRSLGIAPGWPLLLASASLLTMRDAEIFKDRAEKIAFVKGDSDVVFAQVARAIDVMQGAGIDRIGLITAKLEAGQ